MNFSNIKKLVFPLLAVAVFSACDKPDTTDQLADKGQNTIRVNTYGGVDANFNNSALVLDGSSTSETVEFQLEYIGPQVFGQDLTITVAVNDAARTAYNAANPTSQYEALPTTMYTLNTTSATIKAGDVFSSTLSITLDPSQFDPAISYMVPVSIVSIAGGSNGVKAAPSTGTAYFHIIGNPLAGNYHSTGFFYHPTPASCRPVDEDKTLLPNSPDELYCDVADLGPSGYVAIFKTDLTTNKVTIRVAPGAAGGPYTQWDTDLPNSFPGYTPLWPSSAQCNNTYDPATKTFKVRYGYLNTATGYRVTEELITKL